MSAAAGAKPAGNGISAQLARAKAAAAAAMAAINGGGDASKAGAGGASASAGAAAAKAFAVALSIKQELAKAGGKQIQSEHPCCEIEVNDYPQHARWKITNKAAMSHVIDMTGATLTTKGTFFPPGRKPQPGERKLYLLVECRTEIELKRARQEIQRVLEEASRDARPEKDPYAKYNVLI